MLSSCFVGVPTKNINWKNNKYLEEQVHVQLRSYSPPLPHVLGFFAALNSNLCLPTVATIISHKEIRFQCNRVGHKEIIYLALV